MNQVVTLKSELDKKFKALSKSPTVSILMKRSEKLTSFIIKNTSETDIYMRPCTDIYLRHVLLEHKLSVMQSALARLAKGA